ncbi:MAG: bifunctional methylenetetrahydrofolate dehydrogenase/methenyltetrahydrofolate cyclohydrolase FolD [Candidatus Margulisiibacteriota bacterium]
MSQMIDGKMHAQKMRARLANELKVLVSKGIHPSLTVIIVGDNPASQTYVANKEKQAKEVGIRSQVIRLSADSTQNELLQILATLNQDPSIHGILVQLPLPRHIDEDQVILALDPLKDVDGFHPINVGRLVMGHPQAFVPCTPAGVLELLREYRVELTGKEVVIVGRSNIVGKPLIQLFLQQNATVTVCHSKTVNLENVTKRADVLVVAIGKDHFIQAKHVQKGAIVIDVGINRIDGKLFGDVDFDSVAPVASLITPVPGGVGPMTIAMLLRNTLKAASLQNEC